MSTLKEKIINRVPGRAWGPMSYGKGTENIFQAVKHLMFNPDNYVQSQLDRAHYLLNNESLSERDREDLEGYLTHRDGMAMYLGLPQNSDSFIPAEYTPTRGNFVNGKGYYIRYMRNRPVQEGIMEAYNDPNNQELLNKGRGVQLVSPYSRAYSLSKGRDNKGEYAAIYDEWDYHMLANQQQEIDNLNGKDVIAPIIGGKPFSIYDRIYLDDFYNVPEQYRGTTYLPEITVIANPENITERDMIQRVLGNFGREFKQPLKTLNDKQISSLITNRNLSGDELIKEWESKGLLKKRGGKLNYLNFFK